MQYSSKHTNTEVLGAGLEERVLGALARLGGKGGRGGLLTGLGLRGLVIETNISEMIDSNEAAAMSMYPEL